MSGARDTPRAWTITLYDPMLLRDLPIVVIAQVGFNEGPPVPGVEFIDAHTMFPDGIMVLLASVSIPFEHCTFTSADAIQGWYLTVGGLDLLTPHGSEITFHHGDVQVPMTTSFTDWHPRQGVPDGTYRVELDMFVQGITTSTGRASGRH